MTDTVLAPWASFFSTGAESAATLTGLVMVAISVNVQKIISHKHLPARALMAVGALAMALVLSLAALIPQPPVAFAVELDLAMAWAWTMHVSTGQRVYRGHRQAGRPRHERILLFVLGQVQLWPLTLGALLLTFGRMGGLYFIAAGLAASLVVSVINGWILLVEILR